MTHYFRIMAGRKSAYLQECLSENFIGVDFGIRQDLTNHLPENYRAFNEEFKLVFLAAHPDKSKVTAGLACGMLWTVAKYLQTGDMIFCPDGNKRYFVGEIVGDYFYQPDGNLPHRRTVRWLEKTIQRDEMSEALQNSVGSIGTVCDITKYSAEISQLMGPGYSPEAAPIHEIIEDRAAFAMEKHLEDFLIQNWAKSGLGQGYDIYQDEGETGQQVRTDTGYIDILAISKDRKTLLVVELKKGRPGDAVVGQILRYMSYVEDELAEKDQQVRGVIIAPEKDPKIQRALKMLPTVDFYNYQISFKLVKV